ncbi:hypothetical protein L5B71_01085 [Avibacterium sp. 21-586]|uniref:hypothetical protein n=1 Tax=Avibacterium sp. 21-586 TaxID=2911534 RepID=UPI0022471D10|nr:hypothetical protein [Avibacterium sp. 21-586]MCW9709489.1 hypothetical protein [Avibacterium sp. 21-586]
MGFLLLLIVFPFVAGMILVSGVSALIIAGSLILITINLAIRFWYLVLTVMLIMLFPVLYLEGLLLWLLVPIILLAMLGIFSLITEQKTETQ